MGILQSMGLKKQQKPIYLMVLSGKGGTGKSTVALSLAQKLVQDEFKTGILDCDITTPNIHKMLGLSKVQLDVIGDPPDDKILPMEVNGLKLISLGFDTEDDQGILFEGDRINDMVETMINHVEWGDLDYIVIDMPPGTSGEFNTVVRMLPETMLAIVVMIPAATSRMDASRVLTSLKHKHIEVLGIVENMSDIFENGMGQELSAQYEVPFLGPMDFHKDVPRSMKEGKNTMLDHTDFRSVYNAILRRVSECQ